LRPRARVAALIWCPYKIPGNLGLGGPLPSFLEEHEVTSSSIERNARKKKSCELPQETIAVSDEGTAFLW